MIVILVVIVAIIILGALMKAVDEITRKLGGGFTAILSEAIMPIFIILLLIIGLGILYSLSY